MVGADGTIIARKNQSGDIGKFIKNEHGDVTNVISETASNTYKYEPWGTITAKTGTFDNPIRYSGEYYDDESGLIYLRNRYYDPSLRRFISEDPHWNTGNMIYGDNSTGVPSINAIMQSNNLYAYCMNNPIAYIDISGKFVTRVVGGILFATYTVTQWQRNSNFWYNAGITFDRTKFITNQGSGEASKIKFGSFYGEYNGCSWISIFNALVFMGDSSLPANIVYELERRTLLLGSLGVDPLTVRDYFRNRTGINGENYRAVYCLDNYDLNAQTGDSAILMYAHNGGAHYIGLKWNGSQYEAYNVYSNRSGVTKFNSIEGFLKDNGYVGTGVIVVNKK